LILFKTNKMKVDEVLEIFESDYSEEVYDRKARNVMKFFEERSDGFYYNELADITKIAVLKLPNPKFKPIEIHSS
jgi:hypothetical protein